MMSSEYVLAAPALAMIWPCLAVAMFFGCAWALATRGLLEPGALPPSR